MEDSFDDSLCTHKQRWVLVVAFVKRLQIAVPSFHVGLIQFDSLFESFDSGFFVHGREYSGQNRVLACNLTRSAF